MFCPAIETLGVTFQWSMAQVEYATDVVFRRQADLQPIYETLVRTAVRAVKPAQIATFLGCRHKLHSNNTEEIGNDFNTRIQGTRVKRRMGPTSIKTYDKAGIILRIETTTALHSCSSACDATLAAFGGCSTKCQNAEVTCARSCLDRCQSANCAHCEPCVAVQGCEQAMTPVPDNAIP